jgi:ABC-type glycerol-3-phosphate transport system substrate-binding protein
MKNIDRREFLKVAGVATSSVVLAQILAACGKVAVATQGPVHLVLGSYVFGNVTDVYKKMVGDYTAKNPGVTVDF